MVPPGHRTVGIGLQPFEFWTDLRRQGPSFLSTVCFLSMKRLLSWTRNVSWTRNFPWNLAIPAPLAPSRS